MEEDFWSPQQQGSTERAYYMMLNLLQYLKARQKSSDTILNGGKWFIAKDEEELQGVVYKIIKDVMSVECRKEFLDRDETMYEKPH